MISVRLFCSIFLLFFLLATEAISSETPLPAEQSHLTEFDNGLRLLVLPQPDQPLAKVDIYLSLRGAVRNGGLAHFVEHLMFRSSKDSPGGSLRDSLQLLSIYHNGSTNPRHIKTTTSCLPNMLPRLLQLEAERYSQLQPDESDVAYERNRILGEQDFRTETETSQGLFLRTIALAFEEEGKGDPLLGDPEMIKAMDLVAAEKFISRWFRPDRIVVLVSGPIDPIEVAALTKATFGAMPASAGTLVLDELPKRPEPRSFITSSNKDWDLLMVGFRLPYSTAEEAAIVHLTETIMDRENGKTSLTIFDDEAFLALRLYGQWSERRTDEKAAEVAVDQFWKELKKVKRRVRNNWLFERNRKANVENLTVRMSKPFRLAKWRAQRLADDRELPDPVILAAMVDSMAQETIGVFFDEQFTQSRAFTSFAAGRAPEDDLLKFWNGSTQLGINPYISQSAEPTKPGTLGFDKVAPILAAATVGGYGKIETTILPNGIPLHVLDMPNESKIYLGGIRSFPGLEEEALDQNPGRLLMFELIANWGYDPKGSAMEPRGDRLTKNTNLDVGANSLKITADGSRDKLNNIAAVMHKRMAVSRLNPYVMKWILDGHQDYVLKFSTHPASKAWTWKMKKIYGLNSPMASWLCPSEESINNWSISKANKMHFQLCRTGNLQLVMAGDVDLEEGKKLLGSNFGKLRKAQRGQYPPPFESELSQQGAVFAAEGSSVAVIDFMFPPKDLVAKPYLGRIDCLVIEQMVESRLKYSLNEAGFDSVWGKTYIIPKGYSALPLVRVICHPDDAEQVMKLVRHEMERLAVDVPTVDEEAHARLKVSGVLVETLLDPKTARNFFLDCCLFGDVPKDPLDDLQNRNYGVVSEQVAGYFNFNQCAWTVIADTNLPSIGRIESVIQ